MSVWDRYTTKLRSYHPDFESYEGQKVKEMAKKVQDAVILKDGQHTGTIVSIEERTTPKGYEYVDLVIDEDETHLNLKVGYPFNISSLTALGRLLSRFGATLKVGQDVDIKNDEILLDGLKTVSKGMHVGFVTEKKDKFVNILNDSVVKA